MSKGPVILSPEDFLRRLASIKISAHILALVAHDKALRLREQNANTHAEEESALRIILTKRMDEFDAIWRRYNPHQEDIWPDVGTAFEAVAMYVASRETVQITSGPMTDHHKGGICWCGVSSRRSAKFCRECGRRIEWT